MGQSALVEHLYLFPKQSMGGNRLIQLIHQYHVQVHQTDCSGVANLKLVPTNHGRQLRGSPSIDHSLPVGVSAQTAAITLSSWSGAWRWWAVCSSGGRSGWG
ncbi:hypothetical protein [Lapidilactobacillus achengensis]|uniref:hypothetical protein n=1 Tax=Lapidilactobacillus achengensis TaxID=2486000 RepID=UPI0013DE3063|nr:hypothetical protein [Lapidilactobacillus achengensis]